MRNKRMRDKLRWRVAIDLANNPRTEEGYYILSEFKEDMDYCDSEREVWIWSIGRDLETGQILAATDGRFYQSPYYECLFLR